MTKEQKYLLIGILVVIVIIVSIFLFVKISKNKKKRAGNTICENVILHLGSKDNISSMEAKGSRLVAYLKDNSKVNEIELKKLGVTSIMKMSNKVTLVIGKVSSEVVAIYNNQ